MEENAGDCAPAGTEGPRQSIPFSRRKELMALAVQLTETAMAAAKPHELCLLRRMVDGLVER